jgi:integrase
VEDEQKPKRKKRKAPEKRKDPGVRGDGNMLELPSGKYQVRFWVGSGEARKRLTFYGATPEDARAAARKARGEYTSADAETISVKTYLSEWLERLERDTESGTISPATYKLREVVVRRHIVPYIGSIRLAKLSPAAIDNMMADLASKKVGPRTRQVALSTLSRALRVAIRPKKLLKTNPALEVDRVKVRKKRPKILATEQALAVLKASEGTRYHAMIVLALTTGARWGELAALTWGQVDLAGQTIFIDATLSEGLDGKLSRKAPKTEASVRVVDLPKVTVKALKAHRDALGADPDPEAYVFVDSEGGALRKSNFARRYYHPLLKKAEVPRVTFHSLRHFSNSVLLAAGGSVKEAADRLGHSSTRMTLDTYSHILRGSQRRSAAKIDRVLGKRG